MVGTAIAFELQERGAKTWLVERDAEREAAGGRAALLTPLGRGFFARSVHEVAPELVGVTLHLWDAHGENKVGRCCSPEDRDDARIAHLNELVRGIATADPANVTFVAGPAAWCR
mgnify:CR=1 FL=1